MLRTLRKHTKVIMIIVILFFVASCFAGYGLYVRGGRNSEGMRDYPVAELRARTGGCAPFRAVWREHNLRRRADDTQGGH